jgi:hypothetical protein
MRSDLRRNGEAYFALRIIPVKPHRANGAVVALRNQKNAVLPAKRGLEPFRVSVLLEGRLIDEVASRDGIIPPHE